MKPAIQFDERYKVNVGLKESVSLDFVQNNQYLSKDILQENLVCEALVSSVTSLDNKPSLPMAIYYVGKKGKTGENMMSLLTEQAQIIQICLECTMLSKPHNMIIRYDEVNNCQSSCVDCTRSNILCNQCEEKGFVSHITSLRPCSRCLENDRKCIRRVVVALSVDCEEGNKKCLLGLKNKIEQGNIDPHLQMLSLLPDCVYVAKACKGSFSNWYLQFGQERGNLSLFYTLRNKADPVVKGDVKKYLPSNDYVRNRDRQDPNAVLKLCNPDLCNYVSNIGLVTQTLIPETV